MLTYNTRRPALPLPEYGRNIQQMVDHCLTVEDREERTRCAYSIAEAMCRLFPKIKEQPDYQQKLWDHIMIMSGFKLDIDFPVEVARQDSFSTSPEPIPYPGRYIRYRHYGKDLELMIDRAAQMEEGPEREELSLLIANHMKKCLVAQDHDSVEDARVFKDLAELSHGLIRLDLAPEPVKLHDFKFIAPPQTGKKKKKR
ncbi:MAG: DUF4290 domain-containing protein [Muribaculaceae bacterium]|nr:DUF4290 domain-containing protein [Muribaculaceae bacterium]